MNVINLLPHFLKCLDSWKTAPSRSQLEERYLAPVGGRLDPLIGDFDWYFQGHLHTAVNDLTASASGWESYRSRMLELSPEREQRRLRENVDKVESLFRRSLAGEIVLFGGFLSFDGYARFDRGTHRVFLSPDQPSAEPCYFDILTTHEITHVARESHPEVQRQLGVGPHTSHEQFRDSQSVVEHVFSEGLACLISSILVPGCFEGAYTYLDSPESLARVKAHGAELDQVVHEFLRCPHEPGKYLDLYRISQSRPALPLFCHYLWAWQWVRTLLEESFGGDASRLCSADSRIWLAHALEHRLAVKL